MLRNDKFLNRNNNKSNMRCIELIVILFFFKQVVIKDRQFDRIKRGL